MLKNTHLWLKLSPLFLSLIITIAIFTSLKYLPAKLPLFYSLAWGERQLANHQQFLIIPISVALIVLLNLVVSWQLHHSQYFFKKILLISSIIVSLILVIAFVKIILMFI